MPSPFRSASVREMPISHGKSPRSNKPPITLAQEHNHSPSRTVNKVDFSIAV